MPEPKKDNNEKEVKEETNEEGTPVQLVTQDQLTNVKLDTALARLDELLKIAKEE